MLLDALPTFTATELIPYDDFVTLCVLAGVFSLERKELRKKVRRLARTRSIGEVPALYRDVH